MKSIEATELKANCLKILDQIPSEGLTITKRGKAIAVIYPSAIDNSRFFGSVATMGIAGDIFSTGVKWNAES